MATEQSAHSDLLKLNAKIVQYLGRHEARDKLCRYCPTALASWPRYPGSNRKRLVVLRGTSVKLLQKRPGAVTLGAIDD